MGNRAIEKYLREKNSLETVRPTRKGGFFCSMASGRNQFAGAWRRGTYVGEKQSGRSTERKKNSLQGSVVFAEPPK